MGANMLKINQDKTELIVFAPKHRMKKTNDLKLKVGANFVQCRLLGTWESTLTVPCP